MRPRSDLELHSRAVLSVGVMYRSSGPSTGSNLVGRRIQKNVLGLSNATYLIDKQINLLIILQKYDEYLRMLSLSLSLSR